jgi:amino acid permease
MSSWHSLLAVPLTPARTADQTIHKMDFTTPSASGQYDDKSSAAKPGFAMQDTTQCDVEEGLQSAAPEQLKRDMEARHINMIAIAGMIVSGFQFINSIQD